MKTVCSMSSGVDSTYVLWKLLTETSDDVTAVTLDVTNMNPTHYFHAMHCGNASHVYQDRALAIASWLRKNVRDFTHVVEPPDLSIWGENQKQFSIIYFLKKFIPRINAGEFDRFAFSYERENTVAKYMNDPDPNIRGAGLQQAPRYFKAHAKRGSFYIPLCDANYTHANAIHEMPKELFALTMTCDNPKNDEKCGVCFKCAKEKYFIRHLEDGRTPDEIFHIWMKQCTHEDGTFWPMKDWVKIYVPESKTYAVKTSAPMPEWPKTIVVKDE